MTERRSTITVSWRAPGTPARRVDDFREAPTARVAIAKQRAPQVERRAIGSRLENWGRVYHDNPRPGLSPTAAFCDQLRREKEGDSSPPERRTVDEEDAALIELSMRDISTRHRLLLWWCYIKQAHPGEICRNMRISYTPASAFVNAFHEAQDAIARQVQPRNNFHDA